MDSKEFQEFVVQKLIDIERRLATLEEARRQEVKLIKIFTAIVGVILAKMGIDISGILGG